MPTGIYQHKPHNQKTKEKISQSLKGKKRSLESCLKQSETRKRLFQEGKLKTWNEGKQGLQTGQMRSKNPNWKGGKIRDDKGYIQILVDYHPSGKKHIRGGKNAGFYVPEHRLVMEKYLDRYLHRWEHIHHRNGIRDDNRIENLEIIITKGIHFGEIQCPFCNKKFKIR